jgi:hypothetical protein
LPQLGPFEPRFADTLFMTFKGSIAALLVAAGIAAVPHGHSPSAAASSSATALPTVSLAEYRQLRPGMTLQQAQRIMGTAGTLFSQGHGYLNRDYRGWQAPRGRVWVHVTYRIRSGVWRLEFKSAQVPTAGDGW